MGRASHKQQETSNKKGNMKLNVLTLLALVASGLTLTSNSHAGVIAALGGDYQTPTPKAG